MVDVSVFDAKNRLSALLDDVERGGEIVITRRGKPVARLVSIETGDRSSETVRQFREFRNEVASHGSPLTQGDLRAMREEGRR